MSEFIAFPVLVSSRRMALRIPRVSYGCRKILEFLKDGCGLSTEEAIRELVEKARPSLKDCCIEAIQYSWNTDSLEIVVSHPSLRSQGLYDELPSEWLAVEESE